MPASPEPGHFTSTILCTAFGNILERALAAGLDHQLVALSQQPLHQRNQLALLQQRLAAGELDEPDGSELFDLGDDLVFRLACSRR